MSRIGIIAAMHVECDYFRQEIQNINQSQYLDIKISQGQWAGHQICLMESGIGKVNATLATEAMINQFNPDLIINTGSAGGIKSAAEIGDFVFADQVCHHDVDVSPIGFEFGELPRLPVYYPVKSKWLNLLNQVADDLNDRHHTGIIATGESFIYRDEQVELIKQRFNDVLACEMEAAAVAQVCHMHQIDFLVLRNLSDKAGEAAQINFNQYIKQAGRKSTDLVLTFVQSITEN